MGDIICAWRQPILFKQGDLLYGRVVPTNKNAIVTEPPLDECDLKPSDDNDDDDDDDDDGDESDAASAVSSSASASARKPAARKKKQPAAPRGRGRRQARGAGLLRPQLVVRAVVRLVGLVVRLAVVRLVGLVVVRARCRRG